MAEEEKKFIDIQTDVFGDKVEPISLFNVIKYGIRLSNDVWELRMLKRSIARVIDREVPTYRIYGIRYNDKLSVQFLGKLALQVGFLIDEFTWGKEPVTEEEKDKFHGECWCRMFLSPALTENEKSRLLTFLPNAINNKYYIPTDKLNIMEKEISRVLEYTKNQYPEAYKAYLEGRIY